MDFNNFTMLLVKEIPHGLAVTLNFIERRNALNSVLMQELFSILDHAESKPELKIVVLRGQQGIFCTGMDFTEAVQNAPLSVSNPLPKTDNTTYMSLLKRLSYSSKVTIAEIDGTAMAGGVGIACACDMVIATPRSQFTLSEALWGLLPANLMPFLIRRIGFHQAYMMTLTTQTYSGEQAYAIHLVDELTTNLEDALRKHILRFSRLDVQTIQDLKAYFRKMWIIDDKMEQSAIQELARLMQEPRIKNNIKRFVEEKKFPWEEISHGK